MSCYTFFLCKSRTTLHALCAQMNALVKSGMSAKAAPPALTCVMFLILLHLHSICGTFPEGFPAVWFECTAAQHFGKNLTPFSSICSFGHGILGLPQPVRSLYGRFRTQLNMLCYCDRLGHAAIRSKIHQQLQPSFIMKPLSMFGLKVVGRMIYGPDVFSVSSTSTHICHMSIQHTESYRNDGSCGSLPNAACGHLYHIQL